MTEEEWLTVNAPDDLLTFLESKGHVRKLRLLAIASCRAAWEQIPESHSREAILVAEQHVEGMATDAELGKVVSIAHRLRRKRHHYDWAVYETVRFPKGSQYFYASSVIDRLAWAAASAIAPNPSATMIIHFANGETVNEYPPANADRIAWDSAFQQHHQGSVTLLRDIFGNPFRPVAADPAWLTPTVQSIAAAIYEYRAFDRLPILADALEEAGCTNADVLLHCRQPGEHVRGCWVVDLMLGKD